MDCAWPGDPWPAGHPLIDLIPSSTSVAEQHHMGSPGHKDIDLVMHLQQPLQTTHRAPHMAVSHTQLNTGARAHEAKCKASGHTDNLAWAGAVRAPTRPSTCRHHQGTGMLQWDAHTHNTRQVHSNGGAGARDTGKSSSLHHTRRSLNCSINHPRTPRSPTSHSMDDSLHGTVTNVGG